jgi:outer membrane protein assembly factor BamB
MFHNDMARTGQNLTETILTHGNVNSSSFGKLLNVSVDGKVDAQPLYVSRVPVANQGMHSVIYAATEHGSVYAIDAGNGTVLWQVTLLAKGETPSDDRSCSQVMPEIGITATPVIDLTAGPNGIIYVLAMSKDGNGNYHHRLHALDITSGQEQLGGPTEVSATYPGSGANSNNGEVIFDPKQFKTRPGLLLLNGVVYTGWGSHCDIQPYTGWLIGYDRLTLKQVNVFNFAPNGSEAALWNAGGGIAADAVTGRIFVAVANGTFDTTLDAKGFPNQNDFGNAFVKLNAGNGQLVAEDYWTMSNTVAESDADEDLGSGGVMLLPDLKNAAGQTIQLGTAAGKDGHLYVFNRANMGKFNAQNNSTLYQDLPQALGGVVFGSPAWFNGTVYYGAVGNRIRGFSVSAALLQAQAASMTNNFFEYPGATPSISANGTNDAILWAVENTNPAVLHAYDATDLAVELYNSNQANANRDTFGTGNKYITPTVADGRVIVGTTNSIAVFGLIH